MKKYFALGMVAIFLLGFFLGRETNSNSPSPSIQAPLTKPPEATINKTDSVQTKTDVQCFVEALRYRIITAAWILRGLLSMKWKTAS